MVGAVKGATEAVSIWTMRFVVAGLIVFAAACQGSGSGQAVQAAVLAANIGAAAAVNRSGGGCYTQCAPGTFCDHKTGLCETLPCRGECRADQICDESGLIPRCVYVGTALAVGGGSASDAGTALRTPE